MPDDQHLYMAYSWRRAVDEVRCLGKQTNKEVHMIIDSNGRVVDRKTGSKHGVTMTARKVAEMKKRRGEKYRHIHYHPAEFPPSRDDIHNAYQLRANEHLKVQHTVATDRRAITYAPGPGGAKAYNKFKRDRTRQINHDTDQIVDDYIAKMKAWAKNKNKNKKEPRPKRPDTKRVLKRVFERATAAQMRKQGGRYEVRRLPQTRCRTRR